MKKILVLLLFVLSAFTASAQFNIIGANQIQSNTANGLILVNTPAKPLNVNSTDTTMQEYIQKFIDQFEATLALLDSSAVMDSIAAHRIEIDAAIKDSTSFWRTKSDFDINEVRTINLRNGATNGVFFRYPDFLLNGFQTYSDNTTFIYSQFLGRNQNDGNIVQIQLGGTAGGILGSSLSLPFRYNGDYTANMTNSRDIIDKGFADGNYLKLSGNQSLNGSLNATLPTNSSFSLSGNGGQGTIQIDDVGGTKANVILQGQSASGFVRLRLDTDSARVSDTRATKKGIEYAEDWTTDLRTNPPSLWDGRTVLEVLDSGLQTVGGTASGITYTPTETNDYPSTDPDDVAEGLDSLASRLTIMEQLFDNINFAVDTININGWNMNSSVDGSLSTDVSHDITDLDDKVVLIQCFIYNDLGGLSGLINGSSSTTGVSRPGSIGAVTGTIIRLYAFASGDFDNTNFNDDTVNRGYITVFYLK